jgi:hypothetical protein
MDGTNLTDGDNLSGSTTTNLLLSSTTTNDEGDYTVIITNAWGCVTSSVATLTVVFPPEITQQPTSQIVVAGGTASFSVMADGTPALGYQWQKDGMNLTDGDNLSGSATTNLLLNSASMNDAGNYTVIITNAWGSVTSSIATLTVLSPPVITQQPTNQIVVDRDTANFSVTANGTPPLGYQWQKDGTNMTDVGNISGSATTKLLLSSASTNDANNYAVIVSSPWGSVTSSIATLTVVFPPVITRQPTSQIVAAGGTASFSVTASGTPPNSYHWRFNGTNVSSATNSSLILSNVQPSQAGTYAVSVSNLFGAILSSNALLTVTPDHFSWGQIPSPRFVNTPFSVTIQARDTTNGIFTNYTGTAALDSTNGVAVAPVLSGNFVQGAWTGVLVISQTATNLVLRAGDGFGHFGLANPINVLALPQLNLRVSGNSLLFLWPVGYSGFVLETSPSLSPAVWTTVPVTSIQIGNQYFVPLQITRTNSFYRLQLPGS